MYPSPIIGITLVSGFINGEQWVFMVNPNVDRANWNHFVMVLVRNLRKRFINIKDIIYENQYAYRYKATKEEVAEHLIKLNKNVIIEYGEY